MAYATTIFPARVALDAMLRAWAWPDPAPTVTWGSPTESEDQGLDLVYQGTPSIDGVPFPGLSQRNDEEYTLPVVVSVRQWGDDEQATEGRAWGHVNQVFTLLHADLTLGGAVNRVTGFDLEVGQQPGGPKQWQTVIVVRVGVVGIIT